MARYALRLEYDGAGFVGWQRQASGVSIQQVLEEAAFHLNAGNPVASVVAGRTDAGVHADGQVALVDLAGELPPVRVREALNFHMKPHAVVVVEVARAPEGWNPRFSAIQRHYRYVVLNRRARPALLAGRVWHVPGRFDAAAALEGARHLLGRHDFTTFRASSCQAKSPIRTLERIDVRRMGDLVTIEVSARSFLHHQVRNMVGTLKLVAEGKWAPERVAAALVACDRRAGGPTAPPDGLSLVGVDYPEDPFGGVLGWS